MYGHVPDYLNAQALRLRAERAETLASYWRTVGWVFGLALALLICVLCVQEVQLAESHAYSSHAERSERDAQKALVACEIDVEWVRKAQFQHFTDLGRCKLELQSCGLGLQQERAASGDDLYAFSEQARDYSGAVEAAEYKFKNCLSANAGLVESLQEFDQLVKDQQALIVESVELAKRCEASPATRAEAVPNGVQVADHAR